MLLPKGFKGPDPGILLTSLHLLSLIDILYKLPLDVLQRAFTAVAGSRLRVWDSLQGLRASSKAGRELVDSCLQHVEIWLPQNPAHSSSIAQRLANLTQLQLLSVRGTSKNSAQDGQALRALLEALPPSARLTELHLLGMDVGSTTMAEVAQKVHNLKRFSLTFCGADDADMLAPLAACQQLASLRVSRPSWYGKLRPFAAILSGLAQLTQLTRLHWASDVVNASLLANIGKLTGLRSLQVEIQPDDQAEQVVAFAHALEELPLLRELHVPILTALHLAALDGSTSVTHLKLDYANLWTFADVCEKAGFKDLRGFCIPSLKKISFVNKIDEVLCRPKTIRELLEVAPGLHTLKWPYGHRIELVAGSDSSDVAWLLEGPDVVPANLFHSVQLSWDWGDVQGMDAYLNTLPAIPSCEYLRLEGLSVYPSMLATLLQKFPGVRCLYIRAGVVEPDAIPGIMAWPALDKITLDDWVQVADMAAFMEVCRESGVAVRDLNRLD